MTSRAIIPYPDDDQSLYEEHSAAYIACVSLDFLVRCRKQGLVPVGSPDRDPPVYTWTDIQRLVVIRRLHEDLQVELNALDLILHLRERLQAQSKRREELETRVLHQQQEIQRLKTILERLRLARS